MGVNRRGFFGVVAALLLVRPKPVVGLRRGDGGDWWDISDIRATYRRNEGREPTDLEIYKWLKPPAGYCQTTAIGGFGYVPDGRDPSVVIINTTGDGGVWFRRDSSSELAKACRRERNG